MGRAVRKSVPEEMTFKLRPGERGAGSKPGRRKNISLRGSSMCKSRGEERSLALALALTELAWLEQRGLGRDMQAEPGHTGPCGPGQGVWISSAYT